MRTLPSAMQALLDTGGPFIGDAGAPHCRVTIEPDWTLATSSSEETDDEAKLPFRWFQRIANDQTEVEVPNVKSVNWERGIDTDAGSCEIVIYNQWHFLNIVSGLVSTLGDPGHFSPGHGNAEASSEWGQTANTWADRLIPGCLLRTYEGYGGKSKSVLEALDDGNLVITGVWLCDDVRVGTDGTLSLSCRDMGALLIDQQIYRPLTEKYPLHYYRWDYTDVTFPGAPYYDSSAPVAYGPGSEGPKFVTDIDVDPDSNGYWVLGSDGGVFAFGCPFFGSRGAIADVDNGPMVSMASAPQGGGYWLAVETGAVFSFGDVDYFGGATEPTASPVVAMAAVPDGLGYWLVCADGTVYEFGSAVHYGDQPNTSGWDVCDIVSTPSGLGYWLLSESGGVFTYGDAAFYGSVAGPLEFLEVCVGMAVAGDQAGYRIATNFGRVYAFGDARLYAESSGTWGVAAGEPPPFTLNDPIFSMAATPTGNGYFLVGGDGGVFTFGDAAFWGSLPAPFNYQIRSDGNYTDYADIIRDLVLWAGWLFYGDDEGDVYGWIEPTGVFSDEDLPLDMFDKKAIVDPINQLRETVGYIMFIDEAGAFVFRSPNLFQLGSLLEDGTRTTSIIELDDRLNVTDYMVSLNRSSVRSSLTIASHDPDQGMDGVVVTTRDIDSPYLRGMIRPAMLINDHLTKADEQATMLDRIITLIHYSLRQGTVQITGHPGIGVDDQVRLKERITADTYVHYVRGVRSSHDCDSGRWDMSITTSWLGPDFEVA